MRGIDKRFLYQMGEGWKFIFNFEISLTGTGKNRSKCKNAILSNMNGYIFIENFTVRVILGEEFDGGVRFHEKVTYDPQKGVILQGHRMRLVDPSFDRKLHGE